MKAEWSERSVSEICLITDYVANGSFAALRENVQYLDEAGYAIVVRLADSTRRWNGNYKYVSEPAYRFLKKSALFPGDLIMSNVGEPGKVFVVPDLGKPMTLGPNSILLRCGARSCLNPFLYYYFSSVSGRSQIDGISEGVAQKKFNKTSFRALKISLPQLSEQQRIVGILDEAFDRIATAKVNCEKNLQNARALFESHLNAVFTQRSEGVIETTLGSVCQFVGGSQPPKAVFSKTNSADKTRLIQIRDYKSDKNVVYIPRKQAKRFCAADDVMIGRYGPPLFQILRGREGAYNVALMKAVPDESQLLHDYLFYFLKHPAILQYVIYHSERAAGQIGITKDTLEPYPIVLPSLPEQSKIVETITQLEKETQRLESRYQCKLAALDELKKSLLHQAFSGNL